MQSRCFTFPQTPFCTTWQARGSQARLNSRLRKSWATIWKVFMRVWDQRQKPNQRCWLPWGGGGRAGRLGDHGGRDRGTENDFAYQLDPPARSEEIREESGFHKGSRDHPKVKSNSGRVEKWFRGREGLKFNAGKTETTKGKIWGTSQVVQWLKTPVVKTNTGIQGARSDPCFRN